MKENLKKKNALDKIFANLDSSMKWAFFKWWNYKNVKNIMNSITEDQKKVLLLSLSNRKSKTQKGLLAAALNMFKKNSRMMELEKKMIMRLFNTSFGGVMKSFTTWKSLPERKDGEDYKTANKFMTNLINLHRRSLKM
jgi:hypothetical protein